jgi:DNA polymerase
MTELDLRESLRLTLRHSFGDILDLPLFSPGEMSETAQAHPAQQLAEYAKKIQFCESCSLHIGRRKLVFGRGEPAARIAFVGDFPSLSDDKTGEPFSDEQGDLLSKMILAMKLRPEEVYLTNIYKCRPPSGERPDPRHLLACQTHLIYQFTFVAAPVIVALGEESARAMARSEAPLQILRKQTFEWQGRRVIPTHHPRDLHDSPQLKKEAWEDLRRAMQSLAQLS